MLVLICITALLAGIAFAAICTAIYLKHNCDDWRNQAMANKTLFNFNRRRRIALYRMWQNECAASRFLARRCAESSHKKLADQCKGIDEWLVAARQGKVEKIREESADDE